MPIVRYNSRMIKADAIPHGPPSVLSDARTIMKTLGLDSEFPLLDARGEITHSAIVVLGMVGVAISEVAHEYNSQKSHDSFPKGIEKIRTNLQNDATLRERIVLFQHGRNLAPLVLDERKHYVRVEHEIKWGFIGHLFLTMCRVNSELPLLTNEGKLFAEIAENFGTLASAIGPLLEFLHRAENLATLSGAKTRYIQTFLTASEQGAPVFRKAVTDFSKVVEQTTKQSRKGKRKSAMKSRIDVFVEGLHFGITEEKRGPERKRKRKRK